MTKKVWITGASSGIGKALSIKFAKEGWQVAASARRENLLNDLQKNHSNIYSFPLDVTDLENSKKVFKKIIDQLSEINLCIFSTGTYDPKTEKEINVEHIKNVFNVNFFGTLNSIKSVEDYFKNKKSGHIAIVSSLVGYRGLPNSTGYTPSKAALNNLTEGLYFDFKRYDVRISLITPGFIKTPMTDKNTFKMPFLRTPEFAANKIFDGLVKKKAFEISFPIQISIILKILKILPNKIYLYLMKKLTKFQKR
tara:strand:+ start:3954 stop:4709 length:756 start_codon:yes stop_codon:yes gene_type:complete